MILTWLLHAVYSTSIAWALAHILGGLNLPVSIASLLIGTYFARRHARPLLEANPDFKFKAFASGIGGVFEIAICTFVIYALFRHFMWMLFPKDHGWWTLSLNNFGDLPLHINYIRSFANGLDFPPHNPSFASELLRYPYGPDLYNALWEVLGLQLPFHLFFVGFLASLATIIMLRSYASWWGVGAFFLSGGILVFSLIGGQPVADPLKDIEWKNLLLTVFITQRGILIALPLGLLLLMGLRRDLDGSAPLSSKAKTALGLCWGFMPLFHLHSFVAVSLMMAGIALELGGVRGVGRFLQSRMALIAYVPATFFVLYSTGFLKKASILHLSLGWTAPEGNLLPFLWTNFGAWLLLPIIIAFALFASRAQFSPERRRQLWIEFGVTSFLFLLFFNVMLAPWAWDNIKVLIWPYLGYARLAMVVLEPRLGFVLGSLERAMIAFVLFGSGFFTVVWSLHSPSVRAIEIYSMSELANTKGAIEAVPLDAIFASSTAHNHPLTRFGRMRAVGYEGHLWSHGIDAGEAIKKHKRLLSGDDDWLNLARELGVTHIFWGPTERTVYGDAPKPWMSALANVSRVKGYEVYAIK